MRHFTIIVAALSAIVPARAQTIPSEHEQWAVYALIASQYVRRYCPELRVNKDNLATLMRGYGVTVQDTDTKLRDVKVSGQKVLYGNLGSSKQSLCKHFSEFYGENGKFPGIVDLKTAQATD